MRARPLKNLSRLQASLHAAQSPSLRLKTAFVRNGSRIAAYRPLDRTGEGGSRARPNAGARPLAEETHTAAGPVTSSLLEELFPHEITQSRTRLPLLKVKRQVPRIAIDGGLSAEETSMIRSKSNVMVGQPKKRLPRDPQLTVLVLSRASRYLTEYDFRRLVPSGRHIEGWTNKGEILQVICGRERNTMVPNGVYFLLFESPDAAQTYKTHVSRLHRQSASYGPTALTIPPPPELDDKGNPANGSLQVYTLMPASQDLHIRLVQQPFSPIVRRLVEQAGYDQLLRGRRSEYEVLVSLDGFQPTLYGFRGAVLEDGKERGLLWATHGAYGGFREMWMPAERKPKAERRRSAFAVPKEEVEEEEVEREVQPDEVDAEAGERKQRRFIVSFVARDEADRFVMHWHRRDISRMIADLPPYDRTIANAEFIW